MQYSPIEWTDFTANPLKYRDTDGNIVHACIHKSGGCFHCYAETLAKRWGRAGRAFTAENMKRLTPFLDEKELRQMRTFRPARGKRCFIGDMTDIFGEWVSDDLLNQLFSNTLEMRTDVQWQLLTKRADRMHQYLSWRWGEGRIPMRNIWVGVSVEDQRSVQERVWRLRETPAAVRFISYEPALGPVEIDLTGIDWVIVGGESGPGARTFDLAWARSMVNQCKAANVACFVKQFGASIIESKWPQQERSFGNFGRVESLKLKDRKGGDMSEWPEDLRIRQYPQEKFERVI